MKALECTMYSGGHVGAETFFGECCERWGVNEVTFSFDGHYIKRAKNVVMLSAAELARGDISMEIVSLHMKRQYAKAEQIKNVLQSIYHMVNKGTQVFAVGNIHDDGTVVGGTGWGVELGKFFNRNVHVFDKSANAWHTWQHGEWVKNSPVIMEATFCGTGTREMTKQACLAVEELFTRSFGAAR